MSALLYTPRALRDLEEIWEFTRERWGEAQADAYIRQIDDTCSALASGTLSGQRAEHVRPGYRRQLVNAHVVYFRQSDAETLVVVRILHQRMDVRTRLEEEE